MHVTVDTAPPSPFLPRPAAIIILIWAMKHDPACLLPVFKTIITNFHAMMRRTTKLKLLANEKKLIKSPTIPWVHRAERKACWLFIPKS